MGVPQNGWFRRDTSIEMDDFGVPLFQETPQKRLFLIMCMSFMSGIE